MRKFLIVPALAMALIAFGCKSPVSSVDTTRPTVSSTNPANQAVNVSVSGNVSAVFSEAMDSATISAATFTLKQGATAIAGAVSYAGTTATFNPTADLAFSTAYTATITTGAKDAAGNALAANKVWTFTTGATPDTTAPTVTAMTPADLATNVALNSDVTATFSEAMNSATIIGANFTLYQGATAVAGTVSYSGNTATFHPTASLSNNATYTATVTTGVADLAGNLMAAAKVWTFKTPDTIAPTVSVTVPLDAATTVAIGSPVIATFSEAMDPTTLVSANFTLMQGMTAIAGTVTHTATSVTFKPTANLDYNTVYTAMVTTGAKDLAGNSMAADKMWSFTTANVLLPVNLGTAGNFAALAKTGISTTGTTLITGDIGVSPVAATYITGFGLTMDASNVFATTPYVVGNVYAADYAAPTPTNMTTAIGDMETAFVDAAGRTLPVATELYAGDISGQTLSPGLYKWSSGVLLSTSVTLQGSATDVWIFQIAQDLTVANGASVILSGGALAKNVFWQVSGQTTLGTTAAFQGNILCMTLIQLGTGSSLNGRALAQSAITMDASTITKPAP